jgi:hypothetical protein
MQLDLLADTPRARRTDPATSRRAARRIKVSGRLGSQQAWILDIVTRNPGQTSAELAAVMGGSDWSRYRPMIARRLPELAPIWIRKGEARECRITGESCLTWWPR